MLGSDYMAAATQALTIRLPEEVVRILDSLVERGLFTNRSEAIREFLRDYVSAGAGGGA